MLAKVWASASVDLLFLGPWSYKLLDEPSNAIGMLDDRYPLRRCRGCRRSIPRSSASPAILRGVPILMARPDVVLTSVIRSALCISRSICLRSVSLRHATAPQVSCSRWMYDVSRPGSVSHLARTRPRGHTKDHAVPTRGGSGRAVVGRGCPVARRVAHDVSV